MPSYCRPLRYIFKLMEQQKSIFAIKIFQNLSNNYWGSLKVVATAFQWEKLRILRNFLWYTLNRRTTKKFPRCGAVSNRDFLWVSTSRCRTRTIIPHTPQVRYSWMEERITQKKRGSGCEICKDLTQQKLHNLSAAGAAQKVHLYGYIRDTGK